MAVEEIEHRAEEMLLDWMSDAEIGEHQAIVFQHLREVQRRLVAFGLDDRRIGIAYSELIQAMRYQARFLLWVDDVCRRKGRPGLIDDERAELEEYAR